jgi:ERCC4-type nuclease
MEEEPKPKRMRRARELIKLQVDNRERDLDARHQLEEFQEKGYKYKGRMYDVEVEYSNLPIGDYVCGDVCIERKKKDFGTSITDEDDHMLVQLQNMYDNFEHKFMLIVGDPYDNGLHPHAIIGAQLSIAIRYKVRPIFVCNDGEIPWAALCAILKSHDGKVPEPITVFNGRRQYTKEDIVCSMICRIPGIGPTRAKTLMEAFEIKSLSDILKLKDKELFDKLKEVKELDGIGEVVYSDILNYI